MDNLPPRVAGIYAIEHLPSGKLYVGQAQYIKKRWTSHRNLLRIGKHANIHLQRSYNRDGAAAFAYSVLEVVADIAALDAREQYWIDTLQPAFNLHPIAGSARGYKMPPGFGQRLSQARKGKKHAPEHIAAMTAAHVGFRGRRHTEASRRKMSEAQSARKRGPYSASHKEAVAQAKRGKKASLETRAKLSAQRKGATRSQEWREKVSAAQKGRVFSEETRARMKEAQQKRAFREAVAKGRYRQADLF